MAAPLKLIRVKLTPDKVLGAAGDALEQNMRMATVFARDEAKKKLNVGQPVRITKSGAIIGLNPSKPGEPPHKITGQLQNSITTRVDRTRTKVDGFIGSPLKKAAPLEFGTRDGRLLARPYLRPTILENREKILRILVHGKKAF